VSSPLRTRQIPAGQETKILLALGKSWSALLSILLSLAHWASNSLLGQKENLLVQNNRMSLVFKPCHQVLGAFYRNACLRKGSSNDLKLS